MVKPFFLAMAMTIATSTIANCEPTASGLLEIIDGDNEYDQRGSLYIAGLGQGLFWANVKLASSGRALLYCEPGNLVLTTDQKVSILRSYTAKNSSYGVAPAGLVLLRALKDVFPCQE